MIGGRRKLLEVYSVATSERYWACSSNFPRSSDLILLARPCIGNASPHENTGIAVVYTGTVPGLWKCLRVPVIWQEWETSSPHKCAKILGIFELCVCFFLLKIISISRNIYLAGLIIFFETRTTWAGTTPITPVPRAEYMEMIFGMRWRHFQVHGHHRQFATREWTVTAKTKRQTCIHLGNLLISKWFLIIPNWTGKFNSQEGLQAIETPNISLYVPTEACSTRV